MENILTPEQYNELPPEIQKYYSRDGDQYILEDGKAEEVLLLFLLLLLSRRQATVRQTRNRMKLFSIVFGRKLAAETTQFNATNPNKTAVKEFMRRKRVEVAKAHKKVVDVAIQANTGATTGSRNINISNTGSQNINISEIRPEAEAPAINQTNYFTNFADQTEKGTHKLHPGRMAMYGTAVYTTFQNADRILKTKLGVSRERRVLGFAEHCPTCIREANKGWQAVGTLNEIGNSECLTRCRCHFEYK